MKKLLAIFTVITMAFTGCSIKKDKKTADEMPPDKPWNRVIMETENGFYYQASLYNMSLRYSEKSNGTDIYLCAKPECQHSRETSCTATYPFMNVSNYVLYDGFIYFFADESTTETYLISFYKEALDGSSLDKVAEIRRFKNNSGSEYYFPGSAPYDICIHKGYAYIPYSLGGNTYTDFVETGFARVNILTGEAEILLSHNDFVGSSTYSVKCGIGDYIYYMCSRSGKTILCRYNIKNGAIEEITGELGEILADPYARNSLDAVTENTFYVHYYNYESRDEALTAYDVNTFKKTNFEFDLKDEYNTGYHKTMFYDNKIFVVRLDRIDVYSDTGELSGTHPIPSYLKKDEAIQSSNYDFRQFDIFNDKIYMEYLSDAQTLDTGYFEEIDEKDDFFYSMYSCPIEDVIAGKGKWEKQYTIIDR